MLVQHGEEDGITTRENGYVPHAFTSLLILSLQHNCKVPALLLLFPPIILYAVEGYNENYSMAPLLHQLKMFYFCKRGRDGRQVNTGMYESLHKSM